MRILILGRKDAIHFLEKLRERACVRESHLIGDFRHGELALAQQLLSMTEPDEPDKLRRRVSGERENPLVEIRPRHVERSREGLHVQIHLREVLLHIFGGVVHQFLIKRGDFQFLHFRFQFGGLASRMAPFDEIVNPQMQEVEVERLGDLVIGSPFQTADFLLLCHARREEYKWNLGGFRVILHGRA